LNVSDFGQPGIALTFALSQAMSRKQLDKFLRLLKASPSGAVQSVWQIDEENDRSTLSGDSQKL